MKRPLESSARPLGAGGVGQAQGLFPNQILALKGFQSKLDGSKRYSNVLTTRTFISQMGIKMG